MLNGVASSLAAALIAVTASARPAPQSAPASAGALHPRLEPVEQGVGDRGGFQRSLRVLPLDLRLPSGFQQVYRVPGQADMMMRGNGALFAVFPRSVYRRTPLGTLPVAPPDTHFSIGVPGGFRYPGGWLDRSRVEPDPRIATRVDGRWRGDDAVMLRPDRSGDPCTTGSMPAISELSMPMVALPPRTPRPEEPIRTVEDLRLGAVRIVRND